MSSVICVNLDQSKILLSGNLLMPTFTRIFCHSVVMDFGTQSLFHASCNVGFFIFMAFSAQVLNQVLQLYRLILLQTFHFWFLLYLPAQQGYLTLYTYTILLCFYSVTSSVCQ